MSQKHILQYSQFFSNEIFIWGGKICQLYSIWIAAPTPQTFLETDTILYQAERLPTPHPFTWQSVTLAETQLCSFKYTTG